ncbi:MAG: hypothetical protein HFG26_09370 [Provencibacterium sp.]|jgi:hypothetical protein|nr:hypothetical protein [Provencibacterium sp.]
MAGKGGFPSPEEVSFMLMDREKGLAVPLDSLSEEEWESLRSDILFNVSRGISQLYLSREDA